MGFAMWNIDADPNFEPDYTGSNEYWEQMFPPDPTLNGFIRWKRSSTGVHMAERRAAIRNRGRADWVEQHGADPDAWPLAHPPLLIWVPSVYIGVCARCYWLNYMGSTGDASAEDAIKHSAEHGADREALERWGRPLKVWRDPRLKDVPPDQWVR